MLFHVTITHPSEACPGLRPEQTPELIGPSERLDALAAELGVTRHLMVWGAGCILWAEPEHVAYALIEAASRQAALDYVSSATPAGWTAQALPVWNLPEQLPVLRELLGAPAIARKALLDPFQAATAPAPTREAPPQTADMPTPRPEAATLRETPSTRTPAPASITELLDELDDRQPRDTTFQGPAVANAEPAGMSLLKGETMILEPSGSTVPTLRLLATAGPCEGSIFEVGESGGIVGRLLDNPIYVPDGRLSRKHARIDYRESSYWLTDLGSANGTSLNGRSLDAPQPLHAGDVIDLGETRLTVQTETESRTPTR